MIRAILRAREELVADALAAEGLDVARTRLASIEPRGDGTVAGVSATIRTTIATEERLVYIDDSRHPAALWVHPDDPRLPALAPAAFADSLAVLLARMGLDGPVAELRMVAYRPTRRAVLEATCGGRRVFVKVVRPERAEPIIRRHRVLREAGLPVPRVLGWSPAGIMVIEPAHGLALADAVEHVDPVVVVRELDALRARLAAVRGLEATGRPSVSGRAPWYASQLTERMPRLVERLEPLVRCAVMAEASRVPQDIGHGDLHAGQVFIDDAGRVTGLIDVDTTGPVPPGADAGAFTAHAFASSRMAERSGDEPGRRRAAAFRALARAAGDAWLHPHGVRQARQASAQAVGHLLAQAVQAAVSWQDEVAAIALVADAEAILACSGTGDGPAPDGGAEDERALIGGSRVAHTRTRA